MGQTHTNSGRPRASGVSTDDSSVAQIRTNLTFYLGKRYPRNAERLQPIRYGANGAKWLGVCWPGGASWVWGSWPGRGSWVWGAGGFGAGGATRVWGGWGRWAGGASWVWGGWGEWASGARFVCGSWAGWGNPCPARCACPDVRG